VKRLVGTIAAARKAKGLTQDAIGRQMGVPQSHLSRLEAGKVDLRTSNLLELARLVDLEVVLVPRNCLPAVRKLMEDPDGQSRFLYRLAK
jgi:transcriptional regulator with XRE-family HTH domain